MISYETKKQFENDLPLERNIGCIVTFKEDNEDVCAIVGDANEYTELCSRKYSKFFERIEKKKDLEEDNFLLKTKLKSIKELTKEDKVSIELRQTIEFKVWKFSSLIQGSGGTENLKITVQRAINDLCDIIRDAHKKELKKRL